MNVLVATAMPMANEVKLAASWSKFWGAITGAYPGIVTAMSIIGVALVVVALVKWAWDRRRGGSMGQGAQPLWGALIPGAILAAPSVILPMMLRLLDWGANIFLALIKQATGA